MINPSGFAERLEQHCVERRTTRRSWQAHRRRDAGQCGGCPAAKQKPIHKESAFLLGYFSGAGERNRTLDLLITSELLYQLSYTGDACRGTRRDCIVMRKMQPLSWGRYLTMVRRGRLGSSSSPS